VEAFIAFIVNKKKKLS